MLHESRYHLIISSGILIHAALQPFGGRLRPRRLCVRSGPRFPLQKGGGASPQKTIGPCLLWPNGWMDQDATWYGGRPHPRGLCARWGPSHTTTERGRSPPFSAYIYCGQTAAWIKMPLGTQVNVGSGVRRCQMGSQLPPKRGTAPQFSVRVCCGQTAGWMKTIGMKVDLGPGHIYVLDGVPAVRERGTVWPPSFRPMSIVATVAHLRYCCALA